MHPLLMGWGVLSSCGWLVAAAWAVHAAARVRLLRDIDPDPPPAWPRLSVVFAARDEAAGIGATVASLREQDYPDLEILAVDDRSEDGTGAVLDAFARQEPRLSVEHVRDLPEGWLGKVHALARGAERATGQWILFTDADVRFRPGSLRRAVAHAMESRLDHLAVAPDLHGRSVLQDTAGAAFAAAFLLGTGAVDVSRPDSRAYAGVGGFNLVRRSLWNVTPGFEWLRLEVLDDMGLARMLRDAGARRDFLLGIGTVEVDWYPSTRAMIRGLEKNFFAGAAGFSATRAAVLVAGIVALVAGPFVAAAFGGGGAVALAGGATCSLVAGAIVLRRRTGWPLLPLFLLPAGALVIAWALARSTWVCLRRGGITWRGRFYPMDALRRGRRIDL